MKTIIAGMLLVLGLTGCTSGGGAVLGGAGSAEPAPAGENSESEAGASSDFCSFLQNEVPRLEQLDSAAAAVTQFVSDYGIWVSEDVQRVLTGASELDGLARDGCPQVRDDLLEVLQTESLERLLGTN